MTAKIQPRHLERPAYVYIRQSTMGQVRHHQQSTERQYALRDQAQRLGWPSHRIRLLDADLGQSGAQMTDREDFKMLVADVSMGKVGAVLALEASRLARSCTDWHRLIELSSLTDTLIIDEDGCYNPAEFNDQLLLGLKGTMSQAELHLLRGRLLGGKRSKAQKGELRFPLPVGYRFDDQGRIDFDPDAQVCAAVRLVFDLFAQLGSAFAVVHRFADEHLQFPKRAYGGAWDGKLIWGRLTHGRVLSLLKNPCYTGAYVFGRHRCRKRVGPDATVRRQTVPVAMDEWEVLIKDHHPGYITWQQFIDNQQRLEANRTNQEPMLAAGPAREGLALLQGLLICGGCGRRLTIRYTGNGGLYPVYECTWRKREALADQACARIRCDVLDRAVTARALQALTPDHIQIALKAVAELEKRSRAVDQQWRLKIERAEYEAQLAQRRYEEVDPSNRLVAATLERRWNEALAQLEQVQQADEQRRQGQPLVITATQRARLERLAQNLPRLWDAATTTARDRKRILRLLIKDITVEKRAERAQAILHLRWQGGACEDLPVSLPPRIADRLRYPSQTVDRVRRLALEERLTDDQIVTELNQQGHLSATAKPFTLSMVKWIRHRYQIPAPDLKRPEEKTVRQVADMFRISPNVVYYWIERGVIEARKLNQGSPWWITIDSAKEMELAQRIKDSTKLQTQRAQQPQGQL